MGLQITTARIWLATFAGFLLLLVGLVRHDIGPVLSGILWILH